MNIRIFGKAYSTLDPDDLATVLSLIGSECDTVATLDPDARSLVRKLGVALDTQGVICAEMHPGVMYKLNGAKYVYIGRVDNGQYLMNRNGAHYEVFKETDVFNV